jgi:adenylate cyclase
MAFWGAPADNPRHALDSCRAALASVAALRDSALCDDSGAPLGMRIGINSGRALVGNIGSDTRLNYTAIGDTVNIASRLEGVAKSYGVGIVIGESTRQSAGDAIMVRELDRIAVLGRAEGTAIFELLGLAEDGPPPAWADLYERGLAEYRRKNFCRAIELFTAVVAVRGSDPPAARMIERSRQFSADPPPAEWAGTTALDTK